MECNFQGQKYHADNKREVSKATFSDPRSLLDISIHIASQAPCYIYLVGAGGTASPGADTGGGLHAKTKVGLPRTPPALGIDDGQVASRKSAAERHL